MRVKILGKMWRIRYAKVVKDHEGTIVRGTCDPPDLKNKAIWIESTLTGEEELEVTLHEMFHASNWMTFSEEFVAELSSDVARALTRMGWVKKKP